MAGNTKRVIMKNITSVIAKTALLASLLTAGLTRSVSAQQSSITCPDSYNGRELVHLKASTKNYRIKICGSETGRYFMLITRGGKTTIASSYQDNTFLFKRGDYIYEVVANKSWNEGSGSDEYDPVRLTITKGYKLIVKEKIIPKSVSGGFMLP
jgi:hypothetical protein